MDGIKRVQTGAQMMPAKAAKSAPKQEPVAEPKDSFFGTIGKESKNMALKVGNITSSSVGGALGIAGLTLGLYAGAAGGAIFLGALGAGIGPVLASVSTKGLLSFLGTSFATTGMMAKAGIAIGGVATGVGAFQIARKSAELIGKIPGMLIGGAIGLVSGTIKAVEGKLGGGE
ncbi:MAG: hypothetical protein K8T10_07450 [Candidatus Eremiobacteraeota bacterium]|nr:hypothetical protein [Candidatus Eremiobacteraeota bacterium]